MKNLNQNDVNQETKKLLKYVQPCTLSFDMPFSLLFFNNSNSFLVEYLST